MSEPARLLMQEYIWKARLGEFAPADDSFLRVVHAIYPDTKFKDRGVSYGDFYDEVFKLSFTKLDIDYAKAYPPDAYVDDAHALRETGLEIPRRAELLNSSFSNGYPFSSAGTGAGKVTHRIYLNPEPRHATSVYKYFVIYCKDFLEHIPIGESEAVKSLKLGDYQVITTCRDPIVIYVSGAGLLDKMGVALQEYEERNPGHFLDEIPVMTAPLPSRQNLRGVSYAEDLGPLPGKDNVVAQYWTKRREQSEEWGHAHPWPFDDNPTVHLSHSSWRSVFILAALRMSGQGGMGQLRANLARIAAAAGLKPTTMHMRPQITENLLTLIADVLFRYDERSWSEWKEQRI